MIQGKDLLVIAGDFARHPNSGEHLLRRFVPGNRIVWVETVGMRRPELSVFDLKRAAEKLARRGNSHADGRSQILPEGLSVITPAMWPFHDIGWVKRRNEQNLIDAAKAEMRQRNFGEFGIVTTMPLAAGLGHRLGARFIAYYCMDDWALWPGLLKDAIEVWEAQLLKEADLVVVTSQALQHTKSTPGKPAHLLPHGVDVAHFARAAKPLGPVRRLTYFGLFDARTDQSLLARIARERPQATIEVIGRVQADASELSALSNVSFKPAVPYAELPDALREADVLLLPYRLDELAKSINPLKIREALATGKPVVAMALPEVEAMPGLIAAKSPDEFVERCLELIDGQVPQPAADLARWLDESSWEARAEDLSTWLEPLFKR